MRCPFCQSDDDKVTDSRSVDDGARIRRRRECLACGGRFTTNEQIETPPLRVIKKDNSTVPFDRSKIVAGIVRATWRRENIMAEDIERIVQRVESVARSSADQNIRSSAIGDLILKELRRLDPVAYIRFFSVYKDFKDVSEFRSVIKLFDYDDDAGRESENDAGPADGEDA